jgi:SAM-dependent methyltransferase
VTFDKYQRLGAYHWREYARPTVYRSYVDGLRGWVKGDRILDVGAGDGLISHVLRAAGVELDETAVRLANEHGVPVVYGDAGALPFETQTFDAVFMGDVIEHLPDPLPALREVHRILQEVGVFYVTTPPAAVPVRPYHYVEYTSESLRALVEPIGFVLVEPMFTRFDRIHAAFRKG